MRNRIPADTVEKISLVMLTSFSLKGLFKFKKAIVVLSWLGMLCQPKKQLQRHTSNKFKFAFWLQRTVSLGARRHRFGMLLDASVLCKVCWLKDCTSADVMF